MSRNDPSTNTKIYGASDDLIEVDGGKASGEVGYYGDVEHDNGCLLVCSDGTLLNAKYGKGDEGIWQISLVKRGLAFVMIEQCDDENARPHSDVAYFTGTLEWVYAAKDWEKVK